MRRLLRDGTGSELTASTAGGPQGMGNHGGVNIFQDIAENNSKDCGWAIIINK